MGRLSQLTNLREALSKAFALALDANRGARALKDGCTDPAAMTEDLTWQIEQVVDSLDRALRICDMERP